MSPKRIVVKALVGILFVGGLVGCANTETSKPMAEVLPIPMFQPKPHYPDEMKAMGIKGQALVEFFVERDGIVREARVVSQTNEQFGDAALTSVRQWVFAPGLKGGVAVRARMDVPVIFDLANDNAADSANRSDYDRPPVPKFQTRPRYPYDMYVRGQDGQAVVDFIVESDGTIEQSEIVGATNSSFGSEALACVKQWKFLPAIKAGVPVRCHLSVPIIFTLANAANVAPSRGSGN